MSHDLGEIQRETEEAKDRDEMEAFGLMVERACHLKTINQMLPAVARAAKAAKDLAAARQARDLPDNAQRDKAIVSEYTKAVKAYTLYDRAAIQDRIGRKNGVTARTVREILRKAKKQS